MPGLTELHCVVLPDTRDGEIVSSTLEVAAEVWNREDWHEIALPPVQARNARLRVLGNVARAHLSFEESIDDLVPGPGTPRTFFARWVITERSESPRWLATPAWGWSVVGAKPKKQPFEPWFTCGDALVNAPAGAKLAPSDEHWTRVFTHADGELLLRHGQKPLESRPIVHHPLASLICDREYPPGVPAANLRFELRLLTAFDDDTRHFARVWTCHLVLETHAWTLLPDVRPPPLYKVEVPR